MSKKLLEAYEAYLQLDKEFRSGDAAGFNDFMAGAAAMAELFASGQENKAREAITELHRIADRFPELRK